MSRADEPTVLPDEDDEITTDVDPAWVAGIRAETRGSASSPGAEDDEAGGGDRVDDWSRAEPMWDPEATVGASDGLIERIRQEVRAAPSRPVAAPTPAPPAPPPPASSASSATDRAAAVPPPPPPIVERPVAAVPAHESTARDAPSAVEIPIAARGAERRRTHLDHGALGTTSTSRRNCARDRNSPDHPIDTPRARPDEDRDRSHRGRGARDRRLARRRFTRQRRPRTARRLRPDVRRRHRLDRSHPQRTRRPGRRRRMTPRPLPIASRFAAVDRPTRERIDCHKSSSRGLRQSIGRPVARSTATNPGARAVPVAWRGGGSQRAGG